MANMVKLLRRSLPIAFLFLSCLPAHATHLLGGNLGYTYIGETFPGSQVYRYRITMEFYLNCGTDSNWPTLASILNTNNGIMPVGVYAQDPVAPDDPKPLFTTANLTLTDSSTITPQFPDGCTLGAGLCAKLGVLTGLVDLPLNFGGYDLYFQMNARNLSILNLFNPNNTGIGYYAYIPPPLVHNSSPTWLGSPTPMLCIGDTSTFINSATDPDGDQLIFSFVTPYNSVDPGGGIINPPNTLPSNIPVVNYVAGYSVAQPFGAGGYALINGATGLTRYVPPMVGNYVVAVEVKEFRNGILVGKTRRDLQLQAVPCPPNAAPVALGAQPTNYTVLAGDDLCFDLNFQDPDADSLHLSASGSIFNGTLFNPPATITAPVDGLSTIGTTFCWDTQCAQAQSQPYLFSLSVSDGGCPPRTLDVVYQVTVQQPMAPTAIAGSAQVCPNSPPNTYSTPAIANATFTWSVTAGTILTGQGSNSISVQWAGMGAGLVSVVSNNPFGCSSTPFELPVTIAPQTIASAGPDATICPGEAFTVGGSPTGPPGSSYSWTPAAGLSSATSANPSSSPSSSTTYVVHVSANGCPGIDTVVVTVSQPQLAAGPDAEFCAGSGVQLNATGLGTISWSPTTGLSDPNIFNPIASPTTSTTYTATILNGDGCSATDSLTVTVNPIPQAAAGIDQTPCTNTSINLGGAPTGPAGSTFSWSPAIGLNDPANPNPTLAVTGDATYTVTVTDGNQCSSSDLVTITVLPVPNVNAGPDFSVCSGDSVQLQGSGSGTLLWTPAFGLSDPNVPDPICLPETTTTYILTVTDGNTCTNSDQAIVTVNVLPSAQAGPDLTVCPGDSVQIGVNGPGIFTWSPALGLSNANIATPMAAPTATTTYVVTLTDPMACAAQDSVVLTVVQLPQVDAGTDVDICAGSGIAIGGSPTSTTGVIYTWSPASGLNDASLANPVAMPGTTTVYTVVVNDANQCSGTDSVEVLVNPLPSLDAGPDTGFCPGDPVQLNALGTGSFSWTPATGLNDPNINNPVATPMASTVYTATLTDANGCISSDNVNVAEFPLPAVDAGSDVWLCLGSSTMLQGTGDVGNYAWTPATPLNDPASQTPLASPTVTTMFNFAITDANNCTASDSMLVSVGTDPPIDAGQNATTCTGIPVMLGGAPTSVPGSMFSWLPNTGLSDATSPNPTASPDSTTTYTLTVANDTCTSTAQVTVQVSSIGQAGFEWRLEPGCEALRAFLTDTSIGAVARHWDLLNGTTSDQANTQTFIPYGSTSVVTLTITDANGCNSTASFQFDPATFAEIVHLDDVPNVFTPNGDGQNDMFTIGTNAFLGPCASMRVMNRWGQTLFQSTGNNLAWDGRTQSGEPATAGTYFYVIHVLDLEFKGTVMLNR